MATPPFRKPDGLIGRFAIVKLWPNVKVAEDEVIARVKRSAKSLGLECIEIHGDGTFLDGPRRRVTAKDVDFVIHPHYETAKNYDVFSFVTLWNPPDFYHLWGYRRFAPHLLTHDDVLSCLSPAADDQYRRLAAKDPTRGDIHFTLFHSLSEPILEPTLGDKKLFYAGINWDRLGKGKTRHQAVLDILDGTGELRIYGPHSLHGTKVWEGYKSYRGQIPFDGVSAIDEINKAGIALAFSSEAHVDAGLMSSRLFESLAAGAVVIADENPFAQKHFGDALLYVDTRRTPEHTVDQILEHVRWIRKNPDAAKALAQKAQNIFKERFTLDRSLAALYEGFAARREKLRRAYAPQQKKTIQLFALLPHYDAKALTRHLESIEAQQGADLKAILVIDTQEWKAEGEKIKKALQDAKQPIALRTVDFNLNDARGKAWKPRQLGAVIADLIAEVPQDQLFCLLAPNEAIFSDHLERLQGALEHKPDALWAHSHLLLKHTNGTDNFYDLHETLYLTRFISNRPLGCGRFLFSARLNTPERLAVLRSLDAAPLAGLLIHNEGAASHRATAVVDIQDSFNTARGAHHAKEIEAVRDLDPKAFAHLAALEREFSEEPISPDEMLKSVERMTDLQRRKLLTRLVVSVRWPKPIAWLARHFYRWIDQGRAKNPSKESTGA